MDNQSFTNYALAAIGASIATFYQPLSPWLLFAVVLVMADLRFGLKAARKRGEQIRFSRAWRRTLNKMADYLCWVTIAGLCGNSIGHVLGIPVVSMGLLLIVYGIEISSCVNNYFEYKGLNRRFNFWKLLGRPEITESMEDKQ